jgi:hypothetical protein
VAGGLSALGSVPNITHWSRITISIARRMADPPFRYRRAMDASPSLFLWSEQWKQDDVADRLRTGE